MKFTENEIDLIRLALVQRLLQLNKFYSSQRDISISEDKYFKSYQLKLTNLIEKIDENSKHTSNYLEFDE